MFSFTIDANQLSKGLRPSKLMPRNTKFLTECKGAVGKDGVLQAGDELVRFDTTSISAIFPYPQIFVFTEMVIVCTATDIYEVVSGVLTHKLTVAEGRTWSAVDYAEFVYLSNNKVSVTRSPGSGAYAVSATLPTAAAICDFNGQCMIGGLDGMG